MSGALHQKYYDISLTFVRNAAPLLTLDLKSGFFDSDYWTRKSVQLVLNSNK